MNVKQNCTHFTFLQGCHQEHRIVLYFPPQRCFYVHVPYKHTQVCLAQQASASVALSSRIRCHTLPVKPRETVRYFSLHLLFLTFHFPVTIIVMSPRDMSTEFRLFNKKICSTMKLCVKNCQIKIPKEKFVSLFNGYFINKTELQTQNLICSICLACTTDPTAGKFITQTNLYWSSCKSSL